MTGPIAVQFPNRDGLELFGILDLPGPSRRRPVAVLLLSPGVKMRVGPHRLYNKIAARLVELGFPVLRFDYCGLGDSEGELQEVELVDVYNSIQSGRYVPDTLAAMDWLQREFGLSRFIACGLCGGAISGLLAAQGDRRIEALLSVGIPVSFEGGEQHWGQFLTKGQLTHLSRGYVRRLLQPKAWLRFLTFQSDYRVIWAAFTLRLAPRAADKAPPPAAERPKENVNPKFAPAFFAMLTTARPMLLIFGGADRWVWEFEEKFEQPHAARLASFRGAYEKHTIPEANHILSDEPWLARMLDLSEEWLRRCYPV